MLHQTCLYRRPGSLRRRSFGYGGRSSQCQEPPWREAAQKIARFDRYAQSGKAGRHAHRADTVTTDLVKIVVRVDLGPHGITPDGDDGVQQRRIDDRFCR